MKKGLLSLVGVGLIVTTGLVHGYWTERWAVSENVERGAQSVDRIPMKIGDWQGEPLDYNPVQQMGISRQLFRRYRNARTGAEVTVVMLCGRAGPVCIHTPDVCYGANGYAVQTPTEVKIRQGKRVATLFTADAVKTRTTKKTTLRLYWGWYENGEWKVSAQPRLQFAKGRNVLYKFYVIREVQAPTALDADPGKDFLEDALPVLNDVLYTP